MATPPPPSPETQLPPPVPGWVPPPPPRTGASMMDRMLDMAIQWSRPLGFFILFLGTLIAVAAGSYQPVCFASSGCANWPMTWAWGVVISRILWTIGLFFLGGGAGGKLLWGLKAPTGGKPEEYKWVGTERWFNFLLLLLTIALLWFLLAGITAIPPVAP